MSIMSRREVKRDVLFATFCTSSNMFGSLYILDISIYHLFYHGKLRIQDESSFRMSSHQFTSCIHREEQNSRWYTRLHSVFYVCPRMSTYLESPCSLCRSCKVSSSMKTTSQWRRTSWDNSEKPRASKPFPSRPWNKPCPLRPSWCPRQPRFPDPPWGVGFNGMLKIDMA